MQKFVRGLSGLVLRAASRESNGESRERYFEQRAKELHDTAKAQNARHKTFWNMCSLALCVAAWITLLSVPIIRNGSLRSALFGEWRSGPPPMGSQIQYLVPAQGYNGALYDKHVTESLCGSKDSRWKYYYIPGELQQPIYVDRDEVTKLKNGTGMATVNVTSGSNATTEKEVELSRIWCGELPASYQSYWPNMAQMVIFTVYMSTGSTIKLAWQGIVGTWCASLNIYVMKLIFPWGAKDCKCGECESDYHSPCTPGVNGTNVRRFDDDGEPLYLEDEHYMDWVVWDNTLFVILMFLLSKSNENTIKFGLSWHVYYMMNFMNPAKGATPRWSHTTESYVPRGTVTFRSDDEEMVVMVTTIAGALIAILATFVPRPLANISRVHDDAAAITTSISQIWLEAIHYFCSGKQLKERFQIRQKIDKLETTVSSVQSNLVASWWETCDMFGCGRVRALYAKFDTMACDTNDFMHALQASIMDETFNAQHNEFCDQLLEPMERLYESASTLMAKCCECCRDGWIDDDESAELKRQAQTVKEHQAALLEAYNRACPGVTLGLSNETLFVYALSLWARKVTELAQEIDEYEDGLQTAYCGAVFRILKNGLWLTYNPKAMFNPDHLNFALRNFLSISITYYLGYTLGGVGSIFTQYSATMASTLSLLISHFSGSAVQKNLQRLLGVSLGNVTPIIFTMILNLMPCEDPMRFWVHAAGLLTFTFAFTYMYYTSSQWSLVGCLIAGFGMNQLLTPCNAFESFSYDAKYKEIGMVTCALLIQMAIDTVLVPESPRQMAIRFTEAVQVAMEEGFDAVFDSDVKKMHECHAAAKSALDSAKALAPECDPKLQVVGGMAADFKYVMYLDVLRTLTLLLSDLAMIIQAEEDSTGAGEAKDIEMPGSSGTLKLLNSGHSIGILKEDLLPSLHRGFETLQVVLAHDNEDAIMDEGLDEIAKTHMEPLLGRGELMKELLGERGVARGCVAELTEDRRCKFNVILRALRNAKVHMGMIEELCIKASVKQAGSPGAGGIVQHRRAMYSGTP